MINVNSIKSLFKHHKRSVDGAGVKDDLFSQILDSPVIFKVVFLGSEYDENSKECCKSKDGTCATMECQHNYRRYGDAIYEHYKKLQKE